MVFGNTCSYFGKVLFPFSNWYIKFKVKLWLTFNEPWVFSTNGYGLGLHAPGIFECTELPYRVAHVVLKSHAQAWHLYDENYRQSQQGKIFKPKILEVIEDY